MVRAMKFTAARRNQPNPVAAAIRERYMDGRWHHAAEIAARLGYSVEDVEHALRRMCQRGTNPYEIENEKRGIVLANGRRSVVMHYRLYSREYTISVAEAVERFAPIAKRLRQGSRSIAQVALGTMQSTASEIEQILDEWQGK
jgi:hypothetical protein